MLCNIQTDFNIDINVLNYRILKLILQPIVENAIIHGFADRIEEGLLTISINYKEGIIHVSISDDGIGMDEELIQSIMSGNEKDRNTFLRVGIKNIVDRLKLQYGNETSFSIISAPGCGTTVHITFPAEICGTKSLIDR